MKKNKIIGISFMVLTVIICIVGYFILPDKLVMQIGFNGEPSSTIDKIYGILSMLILGLVGGVFAFGNAGKEREYRIYMILGILTIIFITIFVYNLQA